MQDNACNIIRKWAMGLRN